jgi:hypothetical protein
MDLTKNCVIKFTEAVFIGTYPKAKFSHEREIIGTIINDSYGAKTGQHTFSILVESCDDKSIVSGDKIRRKGRNVYPNCEVLFYPSNHKELANDKHERSRDVKESILISRAFEKGDFSIFQRLRG